MDLLDKLLIMELSNDCRMSFSELARKHEVSVNTIKSRVDSLLERRIILGFDVHVKLSLLNASFAAAVLHLKDRISSDIITDLGTHPYVSAVGTGLQPEGVAVLVYRTAGELREGLEHLRSNNAIDEVEVLQFLPPPDSLAGAPSTKGLDSLKTVDWKILRHLRWNGRLPLKDLARKVGKSVPTVKKRIEFMRKHGMIYETTIVNIGAVGEGMVVSFILELPNLTSESQLGIEERVRLEFPESFWVSWLGADRPIVFLTFYASGASVATEIRDRIIEMFPDLRSIKQVISGTWEYFRDFRDDLLEVKGA
ncbi:MAG: Lrp/AsnC family transcriptional regulator [Candidatus Thorarchaeota archaeon]